MRDVDHADPVPRLQHAQLLEPLRLLEGGWPQGRDEEKELAGIVERTYKSLRDKNPVVRYDTIEKWGADEKREVRFNDLTDEEQEATATKRAQGELNTRKKLREASETPAPKGKVEGTLPPGVKTGRGGNALASDDQRLAALRQAGGDQTKAEAILNQNGLTAYGK